MQCCWSAVTVTVATSNDSLTSVLSFVLLACPSLSFLPLFVFSPPLLHIYSLAYTIPQPFCLSPADSLIQCFITVTSPLQLFHHAPCLSSNSSLFPRSTFPFHSPLLLHITQWNSRALHQADVRHLSESRPVSAWLISLTTCVSRNDQLSVVLLPALPPFSISCHCSIQRLNLSAQTYSALSSLSPVKIYVGIPYGLPVLPPITKKNSIDNGCFKETNCPAFWRQKQSLLHLKFSIIPR